MKNIYEERAPNNLLLADQEREFEEGGEEREEKIEEMPECRE
jgi:hypothetical protein